MLYSVFKIWMRLALRFFFRKITFSDRKILTTPGPILLACNHPNSFLDAIVVGSHFQRPVHFLARGDVFRKPFTRKILTALNLIPIYRLSEGREFLALNEATFDTCGEILADGGIVLIFAEGLCVNQWALRSLKKGAARIALTAFANPDIRKRFKVLPVGLNYNSFGNISKDVIVQFGTPITAGAFAGSDAGKDVIVPFNRLLHASLSHTVLSKNKTGHLIPLLISNYDHSPGNSRDIILHLQEKQRSAENTPVQSIPEQLKLPCRIAGSTTTLVWNIIGCVLLFIPAVTGCLLNCAIYYPLKKIVQRKTAGTVFYDSALFGSLMLLYPLYWVIVNLVTMFMIESLIIRLIVFAMPFFALMFGAWKDCFAKVRNNMAMSPVQRKLISDLLAR